jgi:mannose-6-phosphate isomerase-like protein (cupin superfamily)
MPVSLQFIDNLVHVHLAPEQTNGRFGLVEMLGRADDAPPLHLHRRDDEGFHVVAGEVTLWIGDADPVVLTAGRSAVAPRGVPHTYRVTGGAPARWFVTATPGDFISLALAYGTPTDATELWAQPTAPPDAELLGRLADEHDIEILGPPGALPN